jgi:parallel beta-helix repeat protein
MLLNRLFSGIVLALFLGTIVWAHFSYAAETEISLSPTYVEALPGDSFTIDVLVSDVSSLGAWQVAVKYNGTIVNCTSVLIPEDNVFQGKTCVPVPSILNEPTVDRYNYTLFGSSLYTGSVNVSKGLLFRLNFTARTYGSTQLQIATKENPARYGTRPYEMHYSVLVNGDGQELPFATEDGSIEVGTRQTLTLTTSEGGTTNPPPGTYENAYGENVTVTAMPDTFLVLDHWLLDGNHAGTSSSIIVLMTENHTLQPVFARINLTLAISGVVGGTTDPPPGTYIFPAGEVVQVFATANAPYRFDHWILDGSSTVLDNPIRILIDHNRTLEANLSEVSYTRTIYIRPNGAVDPQDVSIQTIDNVTFTFTGAITDSIIVVQRSNVVIDGNGYALQGGGSGEGFSLYGVSNVTIKNVNIRGFDRGICLFGSSLNVISGNNITSNKWLGIALYYSSNNTIAQNNLTANNDAGIRLEYSSNWNVIVENNVAANKWLGIYIDSSSNNSIHHNNWVNNTNQAYVASNSCFCGNLWDDGCEGNYWSGYACIDSNHDGIIDAPFVLDENNLDHYPLTGKFHRFSASVGCPVNVISNSSIEDFQYSEAARKITFNVRGVNGTIGYCRIATKYGLMDVNHIQVLIDKGHTALLYVNYNVRDNTTHRWIYFAYEQSTHMVEILEDFTPPAVSVLSPEDKIYSVSNFSLVFTLNESASWSGYSLDGAANATVDTNTTLTNLLDGMHDVIVYANDTVGNMGHSGFVLFTVDTTPPNITAAWQMPDVNDVSPEDIVKVNATVKDDVSGVEKVTLIYAYTNVSGTWNGVVEMTNIEGSIWNATIPVFPYGTYVTYTIMAEDNAGHTATTLVESQYQVIPEFSPLLGLYSFMIASLFAVAVLARRRKARRTDV